MKKTSRRAMRHQLSIRTLFKRSLPVFITVQLGISTLLVFSSAASSWAAIPNAPSGLTAAALSLNQIRLDWADNSSDETSFYIERKTGAGTYSYIGAVGANLKTYTSSGMTPNTTYYFRIRAYNSSGYSAYSNEAAATTLTVNAPSNLSLASVTYTTAVLTWVDNSNNETGFHLQRKEGPGGTFSAIVYPAANATSYTNTGLKPGTEYYYRIRAYNGSYYSDYSNELKVITQAVPAPSGLTATALSSSQINLSWTDNSIDETYFYIERSIDGVTYSQTATASANVTTYTNKNLSQNTTYYYRLRAYSSNGYSAYSNEATASTLSFNAPSDLTASPLSEKQIKLTWTDNTSDETQFYIQYRVESSETYSDLPPVSTNITTYTHDSASPNTKYYYRVRAYDGYNYSSYSNEADATTPSCVQEGFYQP